MSQEFVSHMPYCNNFMTNSFIISQYVLTLSSYFTECDDNYFGVNCLESCNETCKGCNRKTGVCENGCQAGWKGIYCHEGKQNRFFPI